MMTVALVMVTLIWMSRISCTRIVGTNDDNIRLQTRGLVTENNNIKQDTIFVTAESKLPGKTYSSKIAQAYVKGDSLSSEKHTESNCILGVDNTSAAHFRHYVYFKEFTFVYLVLEYNTPDINIVGSKYIVGENHWMWTFAGKEGSLEFLYWPTEFNIWSMNLLTEYVCEEMLISLHWVSGDCTNLVVGEGDTDYIISSALTALPITLMNMSSDMEEKYGPSFWCYKRRVYLNPQAFYHFCKYIVCPVECIKHTCCSYVYNVKHQARNVTCDIYNDFSFDELWWIYPMILAVVLFSFLPLLLVRIAWEFTPNSYDQHDSEFGLTIPGSTNGTLSDAEKYCFLDNTYPVTLFGTLIMPLEYMFSSASTSFKFQMLRACLPFLSLVAICVQIVLDYFYLHEFIITAVSKGVLLGFRSMLAGYHESSLNFMPYLGGPFVALSVYLLLTIPFITAPESLSFVLTRGLLPMNHLGLNTLMPSLAIVERYGSVPIRDTSGYGRIYSVLLGQFFMLLNKAYWHHVLQIQGRRWNDMCTCRFRMLLLPVYLIFCLLEILLCVLIYNGLPVISFSIIIVRAYLFSITRWSRTFGGGRCKSLKISIVSVLLSIIVTYQIYMSCTIFLDATVFITRVFIFTYTGIVVYPKVSYGYLIFVITVVYYMWDCVKTFGNKYVQLLKITIRVCIALQSDNEREHLVKSRKRSKGLRRDLFEHVIENICPRRKQMFCSLLKLFIILAIIGISLGLLRKTDKFRELHTVMHVGTALFTCALPQIVKSMCRGPDDRLQHKLFKEEIRKSVREFLGYFNDEESSIIEDAD